MTGLVAADRLSASGCHVHVYERWPGLGGQVATLDVGNGCLLERYYHHLFTSDVHIAALYADLGMPQAIQWIPSSVGMLAEGAVHPFTTPLDLLRFRPLSVPARVRMGVGVLRLQRQRSLEPFERTTAREWVTLKMGEEVWEKVWGPMLRGKFGDRADDVAMSWLWRRVTVRRQIRGESSRREVLGYPLGGWQPLLDALRDRIESAGGQVMIDRPVARIRRRDDALEIVGGAPDSFRRGHDPHAFEPAGPPQRYDAVIATVPNDIFERLLDDDLLSALGSEYLDRLRAVEYHAALCMLLEIDRRFSPFYWINVVDHDVPFVGLVEQTNLVEPARYGGRRFLYVANYVARDDPLLDLEPPDLLGVYEPALRGVNSRFDASWIRNTWLFREPAAQPVVTVGYGNRIPPMHTGVPGLVLANTTQIYPEDRGTNYSVKLGDEAAAAVQRALTQRDAAIAD